MSFPDLAPFVSRPLASHSDPQRNPGYTTHKLWLPDTDPDQTNPSGLLVVESLLRDGSPISYVSSGDNSWGYHADLSSLARLSQAGFAPAVNALGLQVYSDSERIDDSLEKTRYALTFPTTERVAVLGNIALGNDRPPGPHFAVVGSGYYHNTVFTRSTALGASLLSTQEPTPRTPQTDTAKIAMHDLIVHASVALAIAQSHVFSALQSRAQKLCAGEASNDTYEKLTSDADFATDTHCMEGLLWDNEESRYFIEQVVGEALPAGITVDDVVAELVSYVKTPHVAGSVAIKHA